MALGYDDEYMQEFDPRTLVGANPAGTRQGFTQGLGAMLTAPTPGTAGAGGGYGVPMWASALTQGARAFLEAAPGAQGAAQAVRGIDQREAEKRARDRQAAVDFIGFHEKLAKIPPGPEKNYMIDQLGGYAKQLTGQELPKGYLDVLKKQNQEQQAAMAKFLDSTVNKYGLGLTQGIMPLLGNRPDLLLDMVSKEMDLQATQAQREQMAQDRELRQQLLGQPGAPSPAPAGLPPASGVGGGGAQTGGALPIPTGVPPQVSALDQQIAAMDTRLAQAQQLLSPSPENERFRSNLEQARDRLLKERNRIEDQYRKDQERAEKRLFEGLSTGVREKLREMGVDEPAPQDIARARQALDAEDVGKKVKEFQATYPLRKSLAEAQGYAGAVAASMGKPLEAAERNRIAGMVQSGQVVNTLLTEFTPEERAEFVGLGGLKRNWQEAQQFLSDLTKKAQTPEERAKIQKYARFSSLVALQAREAFSTGGAALSESEQNIIFGYLPSGKEVSSTQFEEKLKLARQRIPGMIKEEISLAKTPRGQLQPEMFQKELPPVDIPGAAPATPSAPPAKAGKGSPQTATATPSAAAAKPVKAMAPKDILAMPDAQFDALTDQDIQGLSPAQYNALKARLGRKKGQ